MMRTVRERGVRQIPWLWGGRGHPTPCGFCSTRYSGGYVPHDMCPNTIKGGSAGKDWLCACAAAGHPDTGNPDHTRDRLDS
jgi:hypothetical protein